MEDGFDLILVVVLIVGIFLILRNFFIRKTRDVKNSAKAFWEGRDVEEVEASDISRRMMQDLGFEPPKKKGGFGKTVIVLIVVGIVLYVLFAG